MNRPFEEAVDAHGHVVWRICVAVVGREDADDVWSDVFIDALRSWDCLDDGANVAAWLTTIAQRRCIDELRRRDRRRRTTHRLIDAWPLADRAVETREVIDESVARMVAELPDKQRLAVTLRHLGDLPYPQVAEHIGCSVPAARRSVSDGLAALRRRMTADSNEEGGDGRS